MMHTLVLSPLQREHQTISEFFRQQNYDLQEVIIGHSTALYVPALNCCFAIGGHGKVQFAITTQYLLDHCPTFNRVICAGVAGGLAPHINIGDVIIATNTVEHDYHLRFTLQSPPTFASCSDMLTTLKRLQATPSNYDIHFGTMASGDEDIVDTARAQALFQATGALAVAWEGAGGAKASAFNNIPFLEIRGITDNANQEAVASFEANLSLAMNNLSDLLLKLMQSFTIRD